MKRHPYILAIILFIVVNTAKAQNSISFYNLGDNVAQTQNLSAVYLPKNTFTFGLPGIGFSGHSPFKLNEFLVKNNTTNKLEFNFDNLLLTSKPLNTANIHANASLFMLVFKTKKGSISFFANSKLENNWQYSNEFVNILANGIDDFNLSNNQLNTTAYHEIGIGFTHKFLKDKLAIGLRLKYLNGIAHGSTKENASLTLDVDDTTRIWNVTATNATIKTSGFSIPKGENRSLFTGNTGFGMDVGVTYQLSKKWFVEVDVNDIGSIHWSENIKNYNIEDTDGTEYSGVNLDNDLDVQDQIKDALNTIFGATETVESFSTKLTMKSYFSAKYHASQKNVFSAVISNYHAFTTLTSYALGYNRVHKKASFGILTSINNQDKKMKIGGNAAINIGAFQMYAATDNLFNLFGKVEEISQSQIYLGFNLAFGYKRRTVIKKHKKK